MTSLRNLFISRARIPGLVRNATGTRICAKTVQRRHWNEAVSRKTSEMARHFFNYVTSLDDRAGSGMTSITSLTLNVHCIRIPMNFTLTCVGACGV